MFLRSTLFLFILLAGEVYGSLDLELRTQDFVLESKQIEISGLPNAFNPSIIRWRGDLLMVFRDIPDPKQSFNSNIWIVQLNDQFDPISPPQKLDLQPFGVPPHIPSRAEDARIISSGEALYIVYSDNQNEKITKDGFRVYIAQLNFINGSFEAIDIECFKRFPGESKLLREKNWTPFIYQDELLLAYSLDPHRIFRPLFGTESCETFAESNSSPAWEWGVLRGGTQGLKLDDLNYLSFFHSSTKMKTVHSNDEEVLHYFMGAYTFSSEPPFEITKMSPEPIVGKGFYSGKQYKPYWHPVRVVFPCGFLFDEKYIWVFYGRQDHEIWVVKLDRQGLIESLVTTREIETQL